MNAQQTQERKRKRNLTMAINVNIRKDEDHEKLMRTIHTSLRKAGRFGTVQVFINGQLEQESVPPQSKSAPNRNGQADLSADESLLD